MNLSNKYIQAKNGFIDCVPLLVAVVPFGAVFGAIARQQGLSIFEIMFASGTIFAGASQYAMLELWGQNVSAALIVLTVFAINFRHVLYSAAIGRKLILFSPIKKFLAFILLVDMTYAAAETKARTENVQPSYYFAYGFSVYIVWMVANFFGSLSGAIIPDISVFGLDFILPLYFVVLIMGFKKAAGFLPIVLASSVGSILFYLTIGSPWHITLGGCAGLVLAAVLKKSNKGKNNE